MHHEYRSKQATENLGSWASLSPNRSAYAVA